MKVDATSEPAVIAIINEIDRFATLLERAGNRNLKESERARELSLAVQAKFRRLGGKKNGRRQRTDG